MSNFGNVADIGVAQYLLMPIEEIGDGTATLPHTRGHFAGRPNLLDDEGRIDTGLLTGLVDGIGGLTSGLAILPDWIVTTNLTLRRASDALRGPLGTGALTIDAQVLRRGRSSVVTRIDVADLAHNAVATAWMTCAVLTPANGPPPFVRPVPMLERSIPDDPIFAASPAEFFGLTAGDAPGIVTLTVDQRLRNPWGIVHGGASAVALDTAARSLVVGRCTVDPTPDAVVSDLVVHYLSPGRVGPVVATAVPAGRSGDEHLVRIEVRDHGADDRLMALSTATVRRLD